jgi:malonyl-CoA/methylmalonyl-CoA synthetase
MFPVLDDPPDRIAISFPDRALTYPRLRDATMGMARAICGARRVAVLAESRLETCVAVVGALLAGVPIVPLNPKSGAAEMAHIVGDADPELLLVAPGTPVPDAFAGRPLHEVDLDPPGATPPPVAGEPEDPALIVYTSGTTGPPKGAVLPRRAIATNLDALADAWSWTVNDTVTHALPLFHVHGLVIGVLGPLRRGGSVLHLGRFDGARVAAAFQSGGATMLFGVPTMYRRLADAAEREPALAAALSGARLLVSGSAPLPAAEHARLQRLTGRGVVERYGLTETLMNTAIRADGEPAPGTVGPPLAGVELRLVDDDGKPVDEADEQAIGEVEVRGPNVFLGYLNRPDATAGAFRHGWFRTGDMATRDARGYITIVGRRATDLIKSGGYKIGAGEIEAALREHPAVDDAAVTGEPDDDLGERVVAWVVLRESADADEHELIEHVAAQLAPHKRPRGVRFLEALPRNELGKVQKNRLPVEDDQPER